MEEKNKKSNHSESEEKLLLLRIQERTALDKIILNISIAIVGYVVGYILNSDVFKDIYNKKFYINSSILNLMLLLVSLFLLIIYLCKDKVAYIIMFFICLFIFLLNVFVFGWLEGVLLNFQFIFGIHILYILVSFALFLFISVIYIKIFYSIPIGSIDIFSKDRISDINLINSLDAWDTFANVFFLLGILCIMSFFILVNCFN